VNALFGVGETAYTAAKGGLISLMRLVAAEYGEWNIRSNVICPATISIEIWHRLLEPVSNRLQTTSGEVPAQADRYAGRGCKLCPVSRV
jgi:NAD(P)-dependent dehydrogenase (short-subunit alcohol dehydrogenase family)